MNWTYSSIIFLLLLVLGISLQNFPTDDAVPKKALPADPRSNDSHRENSKREAPVVKVSPEKSTDLAQTPIWDDDPRISAALNLIAEQEWNAAGERLNEILNDSPHNTVVLNALITVYTNGPIDLKKAADFLERIIQVDPHYSGVYERYRKVSNQASRESEAIGFLSRLSDRDLPEIPLTIGRLHADLKAYDRALAELEKALRSGHPSKNSIFEEMAAIHRHQKNLPKAKALLQEAIDFVQVTNADPNVLEMQKLNSRPATISLMEVALEQRDAQTASALLQPLLASDPANPKLLRYQTTIDAIINR